MLSPSRLPKAPLAEVVFEMRWPVEAEGNIPLPFRKDPGYDVLSREFPSVAKKEGFGHVVNMATGGILVAHSIGYRYYQAPDKKFPIWQIGPGIFAVNESSGYEWSSFRKMVLRGVSVLISAYPRMKSFALVPDYLELRYIDIFDKELIGTVDLIEFVNSATSFKIQVPKFFEEHTEISGLEAGSVVYSFRIKGMKNTIFQFQIGSAKRGDVEIVRLESKVISKNLKLSATPTPKNFSKKLEKWLDDARGLTSPFFESFIRDEVKEKFK